MRKCRKMISVIMLMVMLVSLLPSGALAAEAPTGATNEVAAVEEPTEVEPATGETEETLPAETKTDGTENEGDNETTITEGTSEGASVSDATESTGEVADSGTNEIATVEEPSENSTTANTVDPETALVVEPGTETIVNDAKAAGGTLPLADFIVDNSFKLEYSDDGETWKDYIKGTSKLEDGWKVRVTAEFKIPQNGLYPNSETPDVGIDTLTYSYPDVIVILEEINKNVLNHDGIDVGDFHVGTDGNATIKLDDQFVNGNKESSIDGSFFITGKFDASKGNSSGKFKFDGIDDEFEYKWNKPITSDISVKKSHTTPTYNNGVYKTKYTVLVGTTKGTSDTVTVSDTVTKLSNANFVYSNLSAVKIDASGNRTPVSIAGKVSGTAPDWTITGLPKLAAGEKYEITYDATITPKTITYDWKTHDNNTGSSVANSVIAKSGSDDSSANDTLTLKPEVYKTYAATVIGGGMNGESAAALRLYSWTVTINPNKHDITNAVYKDTMSEEMTLFTTISIQSSKQTKTFNASDYYSDNGFKYRFTTADWDAEELKNQFTITYRTSAAAAAPGQTLYNTGELTIGTTVYQDGNRIVVGKGTNNVDKDYYKGGVIDPETKTLSMQWWLKDLTLNPHMSAGDSITYTDVLGKVRKQLDSEGNWIEGGTGATKASTEEVEDSPLHYTTCRSVIEALHHHIVVMTTDGYYYFNRSGEVLDGNGNKTRCMFTETSEGGSFKGSNVFTFELLGHATDGNWYDICEYNEDTTLRITEFKFKVTANKDVDIIDTAMTWCVYTSYIDYSNDKEKSVTGGHLVEFPNTWGTTVGNYGSDEAFVQWYYGSNIKKNSHVDTDKDGKLRIYYDVTFSLDLVVNRETHFVDQRSFDTTKYSGSLGTYAGDAIAQPYNRFTGKKENALSKSQFWVDKSEDASGKLIFHFKCGNLGGTNVRITYSVIVEDDPFFTDYTSGEKVYHNEITDKDDNSAFADTTVKKNTKVLKKTGYQGTTDDSSLTNKVFYDVVINPEGKDLDPKADTITLTDTLVESPDGFYFDSKLLRLYTYDKNNDEKGTDVTNEIIESDYSEEKKTLTVKLKDSQAYVLSYGYNFDWGLADLGLAGKTIVNNASLGGGYDYTDRLPINENDGGVIVTERFVTINKYAEGNLSSVLPGAKFKVEKYKDGNWELVTQGESNQDGAFTIKEAQLELDVVYRITETEAPEGYSNLDATGNPYQYYFVVMDEGETEEEAKSKVHFGDADIFPSTVDYKFFGYYGGTHSVANKEVGDLSVKKIVENGSDSDNSKEFSFTVTLSDTSINGTYGQMTFKDGVAKFTLKNGETKTATDLPVKNGNESVTYTVVETAATGYTVKKTGDTGTITSTAESKAVFTNTPDTTSVSVVKVWDDFDDEAGVRPKSITVQLLAGTEVVKDSQVTLDGTVDDIEKIAWQYTWENLPKNKDGKPIEYKVDEVSVPEGYTKTVSGDATTGYTITNSYMPKINIPVEKIWDDDNDQDRIRPASIQVQLTANGKNVGSPVTLDIKNSWKYTWPNMPKYADGKVITYRVVESSVPDGYQVSYSGDVTNGFKVTNSHKHDVVSVSVEKIWNDFGDEAGARPKSITVQLLAGTEVVKDSQVTLDGTVDDIEKTAWQYTWENLPKNKDGKPIEYKVDEVSVPEGYTKTVSGDATTGYKITNSYMPKKNISVKKVWDDKNDQDRVRPASITVYLVKDGKEVEGSRVILDGTVDSIETTAWNYVWTNLDKYTAEGDEIKYSVEEDADAMPEGYSCKVTEEGTVFTVTNKYSPDTTDVAVTKVWDDNNDHDKLRPESITVKLLADGIEVPDSQVTLDGTVDEKEKTAWSYTWENLDKNKDGKPIEYTVDEVEVPEGYKKSLSGNAVTGYIITNKHENIKTMRMVRKVWKDNDDQDGIRPKSITVQLLANGKVLEGSQVVLDGIPDEDPNLEYVSWYHSWRDLDFYDENGEPIEYKVDEVDVPDGYELSIYHGIPASVITNTHETYKTEVSVKKVWDDDENRDRVRPESITVKLLADGVEVPNSQVTLDGTVDEKEETAWSYTWKELDKNNAGKAIVYTVDEVEVPEGYTKSLSGDAETGYTITNTHNNDLTEVSVEKIWDDAKDQDGIRPESITVQLFANGEPVDGSQVTLDGSTDDDETAPWFHTWKNLNKNEAGEEIEYTVDEVEVPEGYTKEISGDAKVGYKITNTHKERAVSISKVDAASMEEVKDAHIQVIDAKGAVFDEWTSTDDGKPHVVHGLTPGETYTLHETVEPLGYTIASDTTFSVDEDGKVTSSGTVTEGNVVLVKDTLTKVHVRKVDAANDKELPGATLQILDKNNEVKYEWTSTEEDYVVTGLTAGEEYTLVETVAPLGFTVTSKTSFTVDNKNKVTSSGTVSATSDGTPVLLVKDTMTVVKISKTDITGDKELKGATLQILDKNGNVVTVKDHDGNDVKCEWVSTDKPHVVEGLEINKTYTLREKTAPDGFTITTDATFSIDENNRITTEIPKNSAGVLLVKDKPTKVKVSKVDITGEKELQGATLQILDDKGKVVEIKDNDGNVVETCEWVSTKEPKDIVGLKTGVVYTLCETIAPDGYTIATEFQFTIAADGTVTCTGKTTTAEDGTTVLLVEDAPTKVYISKTDINSGDELPGATLQILDEEENVIVIKDNDGNPVETLEWVSGEEPKYIEGLPTGVNYILRETISPDGYTIASDTKFTIDEKGVVTSDGTTSTAEDGTTVLVVEDDLTTVQISKVDTESGKELEGAKLQIIDEEGKVVEEWTSTKEVHVVRGLVADKKYILRETVAPLGYTLTTDTTFSVDAHNVVTSTGPVNKDGVILVNDTMTEVEILKVDSKTGKGLAGAKLQVLDDNGAVCDEWTSTKDAHKIRGLYTGVKYTLHEVEAPKGYDKAKDITFTIDTAGKVSSDALDNGKIVMKDTPTPKKNKTGDEANGSLWALLLMMASGALGGTVWFKRKRRA